MILRRIGLTIFYILFIPFCIAWVYPLLWTLGVSVQSNSEAYNGSLSLLPKGFRLSMLLPQNWAQLIQVFHFGNYANAWYVASFGQFALNTVIFSITVVVFVVLLCVLTGYALGRHSFPGKKVFIGAIIVTMFIPHGYTIVPVWQLITTLGLNSSLWGMILAEVGGAHVLYILLFTAYFAGLPKDLEEAACLDGAGFFRVFFSVMFPLSMPIVATTCILQFIGTWNSFFIPLIFSINQPKLQTLGVGMLSFTSDYASNIAGMAAGAVITFLPIVALFVFFQRYFVEGIAGAVKQ